MKKFIRLSFFLVLLLLISSVTYGQEEVKIKKITYSDRSFLKSTYAQGFKKLNIHKSYRTKFDGHLSGIALGYSGLVSSIGNFSLPSDASFMSQKGNSIAFDLNIFDYSFHISRRIGFVAGIGLEVNNFKFDRDISLKQNENGFIVANDYGASGVYLEKSKLTTTYLDIPILLEFQFGKLSQLFVNFGVVGAWRMQSHTKIISNSSEINGKLKNKKGLNMANFRYGYMAQVGYNKLGLYAKYYPESIFKKDKGPKVQQFNIGLTVYFRNLY